MRVISRLQSMHYKNTRNPCAEIAGELNVDAALEGTIMRSGTRVRMTVQLVPRSRSTTSGARCTRVIFAMCSICHAMWPATSDAK